MKKILFLLLVTISSYAQTYQNPTFGTVKSMTAPTVSTTPTLGTIEANGTISKIVPNNVPITYTPINYAPSSTSIADQLAGIDTRLGQIGNVTAGVTTRVHLTGDNITVTAGTFFASNTTGKGATAAGTPQQTLSNNDDQKQYFTKDVMSVAVPALTTAPPGVYSGQLTVTSDPTPGTSKQRFTIEIYKCNNGGTPIASGITGALVGDLGVTVVAILDSGLINVVASALTNIGLQGNLASTLTLNTGERLRYHVSAEKVGTDGGAVTMNVYYGTNYNSYYDIPVTFRASTVLNDSGVSGQTVANALDNLNTDKLGGSGTVNTLPVFTASKTLGNSNVAQSGYSVGIGGVLNNEGIGDPANVFNVTNDTGGAGAGVPRFLIQGTSYANDTGLANVTIRKARGTAAIPLAVQNNDFLTFIGFKGYATNKFASASGAIEAIATENFTNTANGTMLNFEVTANGVFDNRTIAHQILNNGNSIFGNVNYALGARISTITDSKVVIRDDALTTGQLNIVGLTNENKRLRLGYHTTSNYGFVQSLTVGTSFDPLSLNPLGGNVGIGVTNPFYKIHSNSMASDNYMQFTNNFTGSLTNDGLLFGVNVGSGTVQLLNQENTPFDIFTNSMFRARFNADGGLSIGTNVSLGNGTINATGNVTSATHTLTTTPTTSAGTYDFLTRNTSTGVVEKVASSVLRPYKSYTAQIQQASTSAPTVSVMENTIGAIVWTRNATGQYYATLTGAFTVNKTWASATIGNVVGSATPRTLGIAWVSANVMVLTTYESGVLTDAQLNGAFVEIRVYN